MSTATDTIAEDNAGGVNKAVSFGLWSVVVVLLTVVIDNQDAISAFLLNLSPDWLDPVVDKAWAAFIAIVMLFVGPRQQSNISKYYKKIGVPLALSVMLLGTIGTAYADTGYTVCKTPTIDTGQYVTGDDVGGLQTLSGVFHAGVNSGILENILVADEGAEAVAIELCFFDSNPSASTFTDQATQAIADADLAKIAGCVTVSTFSAFSDNNIGQTRNLDMVIKADTPTLYFVIIARGTVTYDSTDALKVCLSLLLD